MTISKSYSAIPIGTSATPVIIECDSTKGLPALNIVGMGDKTVCESRERIRSAIRNSGFHYPADHKITINLAPASLPKNGSYLDLAITVAILTHFQQLSPQDTANTLFIGELALDGKIRPIRGIINVVELAKRKHFKRIVIPSKNYTQARLVATDKQLIPIDNLRDLWTILSANEKPRYPNVVENTETVMHTPTLDQIVGQTQAKRALTVAIAGHHNILLTGPPGTGKSMLASAARGLLPPPTSEEVIELTKLHSLVSDTTSSCSLRPFRAPHHGASQAALLGSANGLPGEISLAHLGVLFLDEIPEFRRDFLEALRQPLENKTITINRANYRITYPADFMLIATMNPCPCGYYGSTDHECRCPQSTIERYRHKLSGPLLDRIDIIIRVPKVDTSVLVKTTTTSTQEHASAKRIIQSTLSKQFKRSHKYNAALSSAETLQHCILDNTAKTLLDSASNKLSLSARAYFKLLKVARTIADMEASSNITAQHISEALQYRATTI